MSDVEPPTMPPPPEELLAQPAPESTKEERTLAMLCHLLGLCGFVIPFGNIVGPLVLWLIKKDELRLVDDQGKESLNFQIAVTLALIVSGFSFLCIVGFVLFPAVLIADVVYIIIAAMKANEGTAYRYPYTWRIIK